MHSYFKKLSQKLCKLSRDQVEELLNDVILENESLYSIFESLSTGLIITDNDFYPLKSNTIAESRLDLSLHLDAPEAQKTPVYQLINDKEIADFIKKCAEKEITNSSEDFTTMTPGESVVFITVSVSPLMKNGNLCGRIILIRDITDKKNQEVLVHRMENMANLTTLAAGMAHDIKNPLGAISIHIQLVEKALKKARENNDVLPAKKFVEDHIAVVNEEIDHLNKLVMDFLFAVRPVNATLELKNPGELIKNIAAFFTPEFNDSNVEVEFSANDNGQRIMLDEKLLREVIMNLSQNALDALKTRYADKKAEDKAFIHPLFKIECLVKDNKYLISLMDNGCGMKEETVAKIFEPYFTTKSHGTGLGMTMVYKIIKEFSGDISVKSKENEGTCFVLSFPLPQSNTKLLNT